MSGTVTLMTDRGSFEALWRPPLEQYGLTVHTVAPATQAELATPGALLVVDAGGGAFDEDELLTLVGFARAMGARPVVDLPTDGPLRAIDDVVDELCLGLVARREHDVARIAAALARRSDPARSRRFEFVTVSPRDDELLAILGDGRPMLLHRPVGGADDGTDVVAIELAEDAASVVLRLAGGGHLALEAPRVAASMGNGANGAANGIATDGARLGARLRELRLAAGLTQAELARRTGIHRPNIARVEAGRHTPSLETLARLATAIGVSATHVLSGE
jgi:DNA-binding XRE family transcriptional regulator